MSPQASDLVLYLTVRGRNKKKDSGYTGTREEVRRNMKVCVGGHTSSHKAEFNDAAVGSWDS